MNKRVLNIIALAELIIAIIMYFAIAYQFDNDRIIMRIMTHTDFEATLLRLSIYIIPGINIICGIFQIVFSTNGLILFTGLLEVLAGYMTLYYKGRSDMMFVMSIIMICLGAIVAIMSLIAMIIEKVKTKKSR